MRPRQRVQVATAVPPDRRLLEPRIKDWLTPEEFAALDTKTPHAGRHLAAVAAPRYRAAVDDWFREWQAAGSSSSVVRVDFKTAQRLAAQPDPDALLVRWAREISIGRSIPWRP